MYYFDNSVVFIRQVFNGITISVWLDKYKFNINRVSGRGRGRERERESKLILPLHLGGPLDQ